MKWAYLFLGLFAVTFTVLFAVDGPPPDQPHAFRICITASLVNLGIFFVMHYVQKRPKEADPADRANAWKSDLNR